LTGNTGFALGLSYCNYRTIRSCGNYYHKTKFAFCQFLYYISW